MLGKRGPGAAADGNSPEREALLADSIGAAPLVELDTPASAERVNPILHNVFEVPFEEIAIIVGRAPTAARQLASRARRRVRDGARESGTDLTLQRDVVNAFLAASREGYFEALLALLAFDGGAGQSTETFG
jgi:hypothetical protein